MSCLRADVAALALAAAATCACSAPAEAPAGAFKSAPRPLPALTGAPLTTDQTLAVVHEVVSDPPASPDEPAGIDSLLADGYGETTLGPAQAIVPMTLDDAPPPTPGPNARMLTRFFHLAD